MTRNLTPNQYSDRLQDLHCMYYGNIILISKILEMYISVRYTDDRKLLWLQTDKKCRLLLPLTNMLTHTASAHMYNNSTAWARHISSHFMMRFNVHLYYCRAVAKPWISTLLWSAVLIVFDLSQILPPLRSPPDSFNCFPGNTEQLLLHSAQASLNISRFFNFDSRLHLAVLR